MSHEYYGDDSIPYWLVRIARAVESIAESLEKVANPPIVIDSEVGAS